MKLTITGTTAALLLAICGYAAAEQNAAGSKRMLQPVANVTSESDADLLAERHLALYRASQRQLLSPESDGGDAVPPPARTSATAAIPLGSRAPALPETNTQ